MNLDRRLLHLLRGQWAPFVGAVLGGAATGLLAILQARLLSQVIAAVFLGQADLAAVWPALSTLLGVIAARAFSTYLGEGSGAALARAVKGNLRTRLAEKLFSLGPLYARSRAPGELAHTLVSAVDDLDAYFSQYLPQVALAGILPVATLSLVFPVDWISGLILLLTGPLIPFFMFLIGSNAERLTRRQFVALGRMSAFLLDSLQGLRALKELGRSREQAGHIRQVSEAYRDTTLQVLRVTFLSALVLELLSTLSTAVIAVQIGLRLLYGRLAFEQAFFILLLAPEFYLPLRTLGLRFHAAMRGVSAARSIYDLLGVEEPRMSRAPTAVKAHEEGGSGRAPEIVFEGVEYRYAGRGEPALDGISFRASAGQVTALVGESGSGKTTVLSLIERFCLPQAGTIRVDGRPLESVPLGAWRQRTAWVGQQTAFLNGTLADNLRIANRTASDATLMEACAQAHLADWVRSLPQGLETELGEGGRRMSGGQAQRLALARAFLRDAPLVLMDEPTAHLDPPEEARLEAAVRALCRGRTTLLVAHRLSTVQNADRILVFSGGRIVEAGSHGVLARGGGTYARLLAAAGGAP
jgi:ATP-binding cassette subfamily C protein CydD